MMENEKASLSIRRIAGIAILLIFLCGVGVMATNVKVNHIKIVLSNHYEMNVVTTKTKVADILEENHIVVLPEENVVPNMDSQISENRTIMITKTLEEGQDIIKLAEVISGNDLLNIAKEIDNHKDRIKIILIAGPSSSGKTTTAHKLSMFLKSFGLNPKPLSIDDYFVNRKDTPRLPNGDYDFESLQAVDITLFNDHLKRLLNKEKVETPTFNFKKGEKEYLGNTLKLEEDDILIIEGLHAINEELTKDIERDKKYKIYISPLTDLNIDNLNMLSTSDVRLLRRIIRDNRTRGYTAEHTIKSWQNVRNGEEKNIFPFQNDVDSVFNSSFIYELGVLKIYASPLLYAIDQSSPCYEEVIRLINLLSMFLPIPPDEIPSDSILREFIGNSYFE